MVPSGTKLVLSSTWLVLSSTWSSCEFYKESYIESLICSLLECANKSFKSFKTVKSFKSVANFFFPGQTSGASGKIERLVLSSTQKPGSNAKSVLRRTKLVPSSRKLVLSSTSLVLTGTKLVLRSTYPVVES